MIASEQHGARADLGRRIVELAYRVGPAVGRAGVAMSLCVICGYSTPDADDVCAHHVASVADDWAAGNRLMCDFLHRGIVSTPPARHGAPMRNLITEEPAGELNDGDRAAVIAMA